jgi:YegS/Rv2252/BmrU family lipid kinase
MGKATVFEHWVFIVNPRAGRGRPTRLLGRLKRMIRRYHLHAEVMVTDSPRSAVDLARNKADAGADYIVAVGGDGTINEVVNGLMRSERRKAIKMGILPLGGGNDLAKTLRIPTDWETAFHTLMQKRTSILDIGCFGDTFFINSLGIGFDAEVAIQANKLGFLRGLPRYLAATLRALIRMKRRSFGVRLANDLFRDEFLLISVGNGRFCGGGFELTPHADPEDGLFDICLARSVSRWRLLSLLPKAIHGQHEGEPEVRFVRSPLLHVECLAHPLAVYYDGEIATLPNPHIIRIYLLPRQLRVICPSRETS